VVVLKLNHIGVEMLVRNVSLKNGWGMPLICFLRVGFALLEPGWRSLDDGKIEMYIMFPVMIALILIS